MTDPLSELKRLKAEYDAALHAYAENRNPSLNSIAGSLYATARERLLDGLHNHLPALLAAAEEAEANRDDADRYRWLRTRVEFGLAGYNGPDHFGNATSAEWCIQSDGIFQGVPVEAPPSLDAAIDAARGATGGETT